MVRIHDPARFLFDTPDGAKSLLDLFDGRKQLIMYHFMLGPDETHGCVGCSFCMDHVPDLRHLWSRDTSFVAVATAPLSEVTAYKNRMGWKSGGDEFTNRTLPLQTDLGRAAAADGSKSDARTRP